MKRLVRIDFDNIGDYIELQLLNGDFDKAQEATLVIQKSLEKSLEYITSNFLDVKLLVRGADDILFSCKNISTSKLEELKSFFFEESRFTVSIGVGRDITETMVNLRLAKLLGKNMIVGI